MNRESYHDPSRRQFLRQAGMLGALALAAPLGGCMRKSQDEDHLTPDTPAWNPGDVAIILDSNDPVAAATPARLAAAGLGEALRRRGVGSQICPTLAQARGADLCVVVTGARSPI